MFINTDTHSFFTRPPDGDAVYGKIERVVPPIRCGRSVNNRPRKVKWRIVTIFALGLDLIGVFLINGARRLAFAGRTLRKLAKVEIVNE